MFQRRSAVSVLQLIRKKWGYVLSCRYHDNTSNYKNKIDKTTKPVRRDTSHDINESSLLAHSYILNPPSRHPFSPTVYSHTIPRFGEF